MASPRNTGESAAALSNYLSSFHSVQLELLSHRFITITIGTLFAIFSASRPASIR